MDDSPGKLEADLNGLSVIEERGLLIASLRYFDRADRFVAAVQETAGRCLPEPLQALEVELASGAQCILAWRSPTETLLLTSAGAAFAELAQRVAAELDGCMVDQTGGISVLRVRGTRARDLLLRLGAATAIPGVGEARGARLAELPLLTVCVQAGEFLLLVERVYANHLLLWIDATTADL
ncbi:MAG TPA: sarcosine oxidase subunit gamma family protein [Steroidobacteraceae bacterium]|nr:sarcosine oxidase subunit gamma family protein [Steroidobacteraceae bacterium]